MPRYADITISRIEIHLRPLASAPIIHYSASMTSTAPSNKIALTGPKVTSPSASLILALTIDNPMMDDRGIAALSGRTISFVKDLRRSDSFRSALTKVLEERYAGNRGKIRAEIAETVLAAMEKTKKVISDSNVSVPELVAVLKELLPHLSLNAPSQQNPLDPGRAQTVQLNINIPGNSLAAARERSLRLSANTPATSDHIEVQNMELPDDGQPLQDPSAPPFLLESHTTELEEDGETRIAFGSQIGIKVRSQSEREDITDLPDSAYTAAARGEDR